MENRVTETEREKEYGWMNNVKGMRVLQVTVLVQEGKRSISASGRE